MPLPTDHYCDECGYYHSTSECPECDLGALATTSCSAKANLSPETDQLMEADRMHWEGEQEVSITAYMRMFAMARRMEEERNEYHRRILKQNDGGES